MTVIIKKVSKDEIIIEAIRFLYITTRHYIKVDDDLWFNKKLQLEVTNNEMEHTDLKYLIWGKHEKHSNKNR